MRSLAMCPPPLDSAAGQQVSTSRSHLPLPEYPASLPPRTAADSDGRADLRRSVATSSTAGSRITGRSCRQLHKQHYPQTPEMLRRPTRKHLRAWPGGHWAVPAQPASLPAVQWLDAIAAVSDHPGQPGHRGTALGGGAGTGLDGQPRAGGNGHRGTALAGRARAQTRAPRPGRSGGRTAGCRITWWSTSQMRLAGLALAGAPEAATAPGGAGPVSPCPSTFPQERLLPAGRRQQPPNCAVTFNMRGPVPVL